ncbi:hypothetical protein [Herbaspirillum sp. RV1423]|uniref:hypothetical protein n=1 Tax=Herbaspirillum sp. RV1423 TaxID=1443993 RepID=UPI0004AFBE4B|nr:hypothetical protein [Herbaspirillum sp. RV1423]
MKQSVAKKNYARVTKQARMMLAARIKTARQQGVPIAIFWRDKKWPVIPLCKGGSAQGDKQALFLRPGEGRGKPKPSAYLLPWVEQLAKVITALWLCEEAKTFNRLRDIILGIRWLNEGILGTPAKDVHDLLPIHFERAAGKIAESISNKNEAFETARELTLIADKIDDLGLSDAKIRFDNPLKQPPPVRRDRTIESFARDALYHCINNPQDDGELVLMEVLRLHFAWGGRIGETLRLASSLHYKDRSHAVVRLSREVSKSGENYGVRYFPEKGFHDGVSIKPLDTAAGSIVEQAVVELERLCAPARERAMLLASMPGRFPLPKHGNDGYHDPDDLVTLEDIGCWMKWEFKVRNTLIAGSDYDPEAQQFCSADQRKILTRWGINPVIQPTGANSFEDPSWSLGRGLHAFKYRVRDFEEYFLKHLNLDVILADSRKPIAKLHEFLIVVFDDQRASWAPARTYMPFLPKRLKYDDIRNQLGNPKLSVFSRRNLTMPDGSPIKLESHQGRHDRNKDLDEAGLTQLQQALAMGRTPSQNVNYQQGSDIQIIQASNIQRLKKEAQAERVKTVKEAVRRSLITGSVTRAYHKLRQISPVKAEEFLDEQVGQVLVTRYGACTNEWTGQSCPKHNKCFKNCKHLHLTGSETEREELQKELAIQELHRAKVQQLAYDGAYKAETALEALDAEIAGIKKAMQAWQEAADQRNKLLEKAGKLGEVKVSVQAYKSGESHYRELKRPRSDEGRAS